MSFRIVMVLSIFVLGASCGLAQEGARVGDPAPDSAAYKTFNEDGRARLSDHRGDVVLLVFFCTICRTQWISEPIEKMLERYGAQGFTVIGFLAGESQITPETEEAARRYIEGMPFKIYWGCSPTFDAYRPGKRPSSILVGADQRVAWRGTPGTVSVPDAVIRDALADRWRIVLEDHPGAPESILGDLQAGRTVRAYTAAREAGLIELADSIGATGARKLERARTLHDERRYDEAMPILQDLTRSWRDTEFGDAAGEILAEYRTSAMRRELSALDRLGRLQGQLDEVDPSRAAAAYRQFARRYSGTAAGQRAETLAEDLGR